MGRVPGTRSRGKARLQPGDNTSARGSAPASYHESYVQKHEKPTHQPINPSNYPKTKKSFVRRTQREPPSKPLNANHSPGALLATRRRGIRATLPENSQNRQDTDTKRHRTRHKKKRQKHISDQQQKKKRRKKNIQVPQPRPSSHPATTTLSPPA